MSSFLLLFILILKTDVLCFPVHLLYDGDGLQMVTFLAQDAAALLLAFLHSDANACHLASSLTHHHYFSVTGESVEPPSKLYLRIDVYFTIIYRLKNGYVVL